MDLIFKGWSIYTKCKSHPEVFYKNSAPQNFAKITRKKEFHSFLLRKMQALRPQFFKKRFQHRYVSCEFCKIFEKTVLQNTFECKKRKVKIVGSAREKSPGSLNSQLYPLILDNTCTAQKTVGAFRAWIIIFFICYLVALWPTLCHCGGSSLTNPM